jgi:hypothetical protein
MLLPDGTLRVIDEIILDCKRAQKSTFPHPLTLSHARAEERLVVLQQLREHVALEIAFGKLTSYETPSIHLTAEDKDQA